MENKVLTKKSKNEKNLWGMTTTTVSEIFTKITCKKSGSQVINLNDDKVELFMVEEDNSEDYHC